MKLRESGMPDEHMWRSFFDPARALTTLGLSQRCRNAVDLGCGFGTFTIPAAGIIRGTVFALDIDPEMVARTQALAEAAGLANVKAGVRDFMAEGTGLPGGSVEYVMLFNILHGESPDVLLREAARLLAPDGILAVMHWRHDPATPRGPNLNIRPRPEQLVEWARQAGFNADRNMPIDLPPYHYGLTFRKAVESKDA